MEMHLQGLPAWLAGARLASAAANLLSVVADHYDKRNNENQYRSFARWSFLAACGLLVWAVFLHAAKSRLVYGLGENRFTLSLPPLVIASVGAASAAAFFVLGLLAKDCMRRPSRSDEMFGLSWSWCFRRSGYNEQGQRLCTWGALSLALFAICALIGALLARGA
jgi:hypothetical protein